MMNILDFENATAALQSSNEGLFDFNLLLKCKYGQLVQGDSFDMTTRELLPHDTVVVAHIFPVLPP